MPDGETHKIISSISAVLGPKFRGTCSCVPFTLILNHLMLFWVILKKILINPYREILENFSKKRSVTQGISWKTFPDFFQILRFRGVTEGNFWKTFPVEFPDYLVRNNFFCSKSGHESGDFLENFSNQYFVVK